MRTLRPVFAPLLTSRRAMGTAIYYLSVGGWAWAAAFACVAGVVLYRRRREGESEA